VRRPNKLKARSIAKRLLQRCEVDSPPVRLSKIVSHLEISVVKGDPQKLAVLKTKEISAIVDLEGKIVVYNDKHPIVRKRFSVAHELGHYLMGHTIRNDIFNINSKDPREVEANMFAAELLMPFDWLKADMRVSGMKIRELAKKYWVSEEAMGWRLLKSDALLLG